MLVRIWMNVHISSKAELKENIFIFYNCIVQMVIFFKNILNMLEDYFLLIFTLIK